MEPGRSLAKRFLGAHPSDAADFLSKLDSEDATLILASVGAAEAASVVRRMSPAQAARCMTMLSPDRAAGLLERVPPSAGAALIRFASRSLTESVLEKMPYVKRTRLEAQLRYPPLSVGAAMDPDFFAVRSHWSLGDLRRSLSDQAPVQTPYLYVVDENAALVGVLGLRGLEGPDDTPVAQLMSAPVQSLYAFTPLEAVFDHPAWARHDRLPVTSTGNVMAGTLRHRDLRRWRRRSETGRRQDPADTLLTISELYWEGLWNAIDGFAGSGDSAGVKESDEAVP